MPDPIPRNQHVRRVQAAVRDVRHQIYRGDQVVGAPDGTTRRTGTWWLLAATLAGMPVHLWLDGIVHFDDGWPMGWMYAVLQCPGARAQELFIGLCVAALAALAPPTDWYRAVTPQYRSAVTVAAVAAVLSVVPLIIAAALFALLILFGIAILAIIIAMIVGMATS